MSIIYFNKLKVYRSDSNDEPILKSKILSQNGKIDLIENENTKYLELVLSEQDSSIIYLRCKLNDLNSEFLKIKSNRICLQQQDTRLTVNYWIEFKETEQANQFIMVIGNLNEVFACSSKIEPLTSEKKEEKSNSELCVLLEDSIKEGNVDESIRIVRKMASEKLNLEIKLVEKQQTDKIEPDEQKLCQVNVSLFRDKNKNNMILKLQAYEFTVLDLKKQISAYFGIDLSDLIVLINDFQTNDSRILDYYKVVRPCTSKDSDRSVDFECVVYLKSLRSDLEAFCEQDLDNPNKMEIDYNELTAYYSQDIIENSEPFDCHICLEKSVAGSQGIILKECLHVFCKECLKDYINHCDDPLIKCPYSDDYVCNYTIQEREIRALISKEEFQKYELKSLRISEASMTNTFHCKTPDCIGFCISEDNLNFFDCPVCEKVNCLRCNTIHMTKTCQEYQNDLKQNAVNDLNAQKDKEALEKLITNGKAMYCPGCKIIVCKQDGCDWLQCAMCKTEICWVTRGPRWGPKGRGDTSGGCKCNLAAGRPCHPKCGNCH